MREDEGRKRELKRKSEGEREEKRKRIHGGAKIRGKEKEREIPRNR